MVPMGLLSFCNINAPTIVNLHHTRIKSIVIICTVECKMPREKTYLARHRAISYNVCSDSILFNHLSSVEDDGLLSEPYLRSWHELNPAVGCVFVTLTPPGPMLDPNNINHSPQQTFN